MRCLLSFQLKSKHEKLAGNKKRTVFWFPARRRFFFCCNLRYNKLYYINLCAKRKTFFLDFL
ncbi:hypothetical protein D349_01252 [Enterococcus faecalis UP2S-6]|nr:hypothetical protein D349_01252 [Enterococcus faecalis UP2S-6]